MQVRYVFAFVAILSTTETCNAQRLILQSPVFANFSVRTNVSVPDRGTALLGSVGRAADGTKSFGPIPSGSSRGRSLSHRSITSSVYIHDFAAMDPFLRDRRPVRTPVDPVKEKRERQARAASAYRKLAEKARRNGKPELVERYTKLAREYETKTRVANRPRRP